MGQMIDRTSISRGHLQVVPFRVVDPVRNVYLFTGVYTLNILVSWTRTSLQELSVLIFLTFFLQ